MKSQAIKDESAVEKLFLDKSRVDFYSHQLVIAGKSATILIKPNGGIFLDELFLDECLRMDGIIPNVSCQRVGTSITYTNICARRSNHCVASRDFFLHPEFRLQAIGHAVAYPTFTFRSG